jgi:hypothetical protein
MTTTTTEDEVGVAQLPAIISALGAIMATFEPERHTVEACRSLLDQFNQVKRLGSVGVTLSARRVSGSNGHTESGHRTPAEWLAARTGESVGQANEAIQLGEDLVTQPGVDEAFRSGQLTPKQASMITKVAKENPARTGELIGAAATDTTKQFQDRCLRARAEGRSAEDEAQATRRIHNKRYCRTWTDEEGAFRLDALLTPEAGARVAASLRDQTDRIFRDLQARDLIDTAGAMAADSLVALVTGQGILPPPTRGKWTGRTDPDPAAGTDPASSAPEPTTPEPTSSNTGSTTCTCGANGRPGTRATVIIRADLDALRRGSTGTGEVCEIPGVGPISVQHARECLGEDLAYLLVTNGIDVTTICSLGRHIPDSLKMALIERDPCCVVPGCGIRQGLEIDHWQVDFAKGGTTSFDNLCRLCSHHHGLKTTKGWQLTGGPGHWRFEPPATPKRPKRQRRKPPRKRPPPPEETAPPLFIPEE